MAVRRSTVVEHARYVLVSLGETVSVDLNNDLELIQYLDFEHAAPCEWTRKDGSRVCAHEAEWMLILSCCGKSSLRCDGHYKSLDKILKQTPNMTHNPDIGGCDKKISIMYAERIK